MLAIPHAVLWGRLSEFIHQLQPQGLITKHREQPQCVQTFPLITIIFQIVDMNESIGHRRKYINTLT